MRFLLGSAFLLINLFSQFSSSFSQKKLLANCIKMVSKMTYNEMILCNQGQGSLGGMYYGHPLTEKCACMHLMRMSGSIALVTGHHRIRMLNTLGSVIHPHT
jgi:hypothetical protein